MSKCLICFEHWKDCECNFANDNHDLDRVVIIPPVELVLTRSYFHRLAIATANLNLSRRKIPDCMASALYRDDIIFIDHGRRIIIQDEAIETAFNNELGFRWLSDFSFPPRHSARCGIPTSITLLEELCDGKIEK